MDYLAELSTLCQTLLGLSLSQERHLAIRSPLIYVFHLKSQCSMLVRNTVLRAILQAYGKWYFRPPVEPKLVKRLR